MNGNVDTQPRSSRPAQGALRVLRVALALAGLLVAEDAWADGAPAPTPAPVVAEAGPGQRALGVAVDADGVFVRVCAKGEGCDAKEGKKLRPPRSFRPAGPPSAFVDLKVHELASKKRVVWASFPAEDGRAFQLLVAAPARGDEPKVIYSGMTGGETGERTARLSVDVDGRGAATFRVTTLARLCGKEVVVGTRALDASKLELVGSPGPDPIGASRASAVAVAAARVLDPGPAFRVLAARAASSGHGALLTDGDDHTSWAEDEPGIGRHAFVSLSAPASVPLTGLDFVLVPPAGVPALRTPKTLGVILDGALFAVAIPAEAAAVAGTFRVAFPTPQKTACVGLVLDEAHAAAPSSGAAGAPGAERAPAPAGKLSPTAYVSEVRARTALDGTALPDLARGLAGGGAAARDRLAVLQAESTRGLAAIVTVYDELDGPGRDLARRVIDAGACADKLPLYVRLLVGAERDEVDRARDRVRRCGKDAAAPLLAAFEKASGAARGVLAEEAALVAPESAVPVMVSALAVATDKAERRILRGALAKAAARQAGLRALGSVAKSETFAGLPLPARIEFLRAVGDQGPALDGGAAALGVAAEEAKSFRDRYLLLAPAAAFARQGDGAATAFVSAALADPEERRLRARAAALAGAVPSLRSRVLGLVDDADVRVREAAVTALAAGKIDRALGAKRHGRLTTDPSAIVRRAAASAPAVGPAGADVDRAIARAVDFEPSPEVRAQMVKALGARGATAGAAVVAERALDAKEALEVRVHAIEALGQLCDREHEEELLELALRGRAPVFQADRKLAIAAISALAVLGAEGLAAKLAALSREPTPAEIREVTRRALAQPSTRCRR